MTRWRPPYDPADNDTQLLDFFERALSQLIPDVMGRSYVMMGVRVGIALALQRPDVAHSLASTIKHNIPSSDLEMETNIASKLTGREMCQIRVIQSNN